MDARDLFSKGDRYLEPSEGKPYIVNFAGPAVTGGPPEEAFVLQFSEFEFIRQYLIFRDPTEVSGLVAVLRDARLNTGRSEGSGLVQPGQEARAGHWLGAFGYMITIEHIGKCFRPPGATSRLNPGFRRALEDFAPHVTKDERDALYALRCCLAHDYSLVNGPLDGHGKPISRRLWHRFTLNADGQGRLIELPPLQWDGELASRQPRTKVNLRKLGDLAEQVFRTVVQMAERDELEIALSGGVDELRMRYTHFVYQQRKPFLVGQPPDTP